MKRRQFAATAIVALFGAFAALPALASEIDYGKSGGWRGDAWQESRLILRS